MQSFYYIVYCIVHCGLVYLRAPQKWAHFYFASFHFFQFIITRVDHELYLFTYIT